MKKILITGANSFIARNLVEQLNEYELCPLSHQNLDLLNKKQVKEILESEKFDIVIHTATCTQDTNKMYQNNMNMFLNLHKNRNCFDKLLYFGSGAEYNRKFIPEYVKEDFFGKFPPLPFNSDEYSISKFMMNLYTRNSNIYNLRLFATFGKYDKETRPIPSLCLQALNSDKLILNENSSYDFLYVNDICRIVKWFIENKPIYNDYNVCSSISRSFYSIAETIHSFVEEKQLPINIEDRLFREYSGDNSRLLNEIKDFQFTDFNIALRKVFNWYKENNE